MTQPVFVDMLPQFLVPEQLRGGIAVVIDILRASTTMVHALAQGASAIVPCETVEDAWRLKSSLVNPTKTSSGGSGVLLGGERQGQPIDGFDLGNSPLAYTAEAVAGKTIVFTTTNGTRALLACMSSDRVLIGAFVNRAALVGVLKEDGRPVHLVCAGTDGHLTAEDILFAGAIASDLMSQLDNERASGDTVSAPVGSPGSTISASRCPAEAAPRLDVQTQIAIDYYAARSRDENTFCETIRDSRGGRNLLRLGLEADIERASQQDLFDIVPEWDPSSNRVIVR